MSKKNILSFYIIIFLLFFSSCFTSKPLPPGYGTYINFANLYRPQATTIFPEFVIYNKNDSTSIVFNYIYLPNLLFRPQENSSIAKVFLNYKLTPSLNNRKTIDTLSKTLTIKYYQKQKELIFPVSLPIPEDSLYLINIYVKDLFRKKSNLKFIWNDPANPYSANDFLVKDANTFSPIFTHIIDSTKQYLIVHNSGNSQLFAYHYPADTLLPKPPFYLGSRTRKIFADTILKISTLTPFKFSMPGIYLLTYDSLVQQGKTLVMFYPDFPRITRASQMIKPLAYLTNSIEFKLIITAYSQKLAVDSFWLSISQTPEQAKNLLQIYYNRVLLANYYFTTHKQGWMSDRGMIYIIFGPPPIVYKFDDREEWIYYFSQKKQYINFKFKQIKTLFFIEDYVLIPSASYREFWQYAVKQWREGIVPNF